MLTADEFQDMVRRSIGAGEGIATSEEVDHGGEGDVPSEEPIPEERAQPTTSLPRIVAIAVTALVLILVVAGVSSMGRAPSAQPAAIVTLPRDDPYPPIPGSLGIYVEQFTELWNFVETEPRITQGLTRYNEVGEYDTFLYRFGDWARVAGAFDPDTEALYALYVTGSFSGEATDQLYLHLCYLVAPYSPDCIEGYQQQGLGGVDLAAYDGVAHEAEWVLEDQTWRLEIEANVLTIRVFGEDVA
jgi:hypothetical protein